MRDVSFREKIMRYRKKNNVMLSLKNTAKQTSVAIRQ